MNTNFFKDSEFNKNPSSIPEKVKEHSGYAKGCMEVIRHIVGSPVHITNAYRTPGINNKISNSAKNSYHMWRTHGNTQKFMVAIDFSVDGVAPIDVYRKLRRANLKFKMIVYPKHIHINFSVLDERLLRGKY